MKRKLQFELTVFSAAACLILSGCKENLPKESSESNFGIEIKLKDEGTWTKSVVGDDIESKISEVKIVSYNSSGLLEGEGYFKSGEETYLNLPRWTAHDIYAFVNMGDIKAPENENGIAGVTYRIPSYSDMAGRGLPMAGSIKAVDPESSGCEIEVERLVAKITLILSEGDVVPDETVSVALSGCNRILSPFASEGSRARSLSDVFENEKEGITNNASGWTGNKFVFYTPENMQGRLLPGNTDPYAKIPSGLRSDNGVPLSDLCTWIEVKARLEDPVNHHGIYGDVSYRFYLGEDNTSDFNVKRNTSYSVTLSLSWNGQFLKGNWKVENDGLQDTRVLTLSGIEGYSVSGKQGVVREGNGIPVTGGKSGFATVTYSIEGQEGADFTMSHYSADKGWRISDNTAAELSKKGIEVALMGGYLCYDTEEKGLSVCEKLPEKDGTMIPLTEEKRVYLKFTRRSDPSGIQIIPVTVETFDGRKNASATLYSGRESEISIKLSGEKHYVAQKPSLSVSGLPEGTEKVSFKAIDGSEKILSIEQADDSSCFLSLRDTGKAAIGISVSLHGAEVPLPAVSFDIYPPVLSFDEKEYRLSPSGESEAFSLSYRTESGELMEAVDDDKMASGRFFSRSLYNELLQIEVRLLDGCEEYYGGDLLSCSSEGIVLKASSSGKGLEGSLNLKYPLVSKKPLTLIVGECPSTSVKKAEALISSADPFPSLGEDTEFGVIDNKIIGGFGSVREGSKPVTADREAVFADGPRIESKISGLSVKLVSDAPDLVFGIDGNHSLTVSAKNSPQGFSAGKVPIYAVIKGEGQEKESDRIPIGFIESYLYTFIGGIAKRDSDLESATVHIEADVAGYEKVPAFNVLRTTLSSRGAFITCTVNEANGWKKIRDRANYYAMDDVGEHGEPLIPNKGDANSHLNLYRVYPGAKGLNQTIYDIIPGDYFNNQFSDWDTFESYFSPCFSYDLSSVPGLKISPNRKSLYHCSNSGTSGETDMNGMSYYVIGTVSMFSAWKESGFSK